MLLAVGPQVEYLGYGAVVPGLNPDLNTGHLLGQGSDVLRDRQAKDDSPSLFGDKVRIGIAGPRGTDFEGGHPLLLGMLALFAGPRRGLLPSSLFPPPLLSRHILCQPFLSLKVSRRPLLPS